MISITVRGSEQQYLFFQSNWVNQEVRSPVYRVFKQLGNGEFLHVASRAELEQAVQLVEELRTLWPAEYVVRDSEGNDVDLTE